MQFAAIPVPLSEEDGYHIHPDKIAEEIARGTSVILTSNPRNPTGRVVANPELAEIQDICRGRADADHSDGEALCAEQLATAFVELEAPGEEAALQKGQRQVASAEPVLAVLWQAFIRDL